MVTPRADRPPSGSLSRARDARDRKPYDQIDTSIVNPIKIGYCDIKFKHSLESYYYYFSCKTIITASFSQLKNRN